MSDNKKRTYTVPILLVIIVLLATFIMISYSKLLFTQQEQVTERGKGLSEQYGYAMLFADRLNASVDGLLNAKSEIDRLRAMKLLGEAELASGEATGLLTEAENRHSGQKKEEAAKPILEAFHALIGEDSAVLKAIEHEGPLTTEEIAELTLIRDGMAQLQNILKGFRLPSAEAGFRQMITLGEWIDVSIEANKSLQQLAAKL